LVVTAASSVALATRFDVESAVLAVDGVVGDIVLELVRSAGAIVEGSVVRGGVTADELRDEGD
jgi:hypothetical protein